MQVEKTRRKDLERKLLEPHEVHIHIVQEDDSSGPLSPARRFLVGDEHTTFCTPWRTAMDAENESVELCKELLRNLRGPSTGDEVDTFFGTVGEDEEAKDLQSLLRALSKLLADSKSKLVHHHGELFDGMLPDGLFETTQEAYAAVKGRICRLARLASAEIERTDRARKYLKEVLEALGGDAAGVENTAAIHQECVRRIREMQVSLKAKEKRIEEQTDIEASWARKSSEAFQTIREIGDLVRPGPPKYEGTSLVVVEWVKGIIKQRDDNADKADLWFKEVDQARGERDILQDQFNRAINQRDEHINRADDLQQKVNHLRSTNRKLSERAARLDDKADKEAGMANHLHKETIRLEAELSAAEDKIANQALDIETARESARVWKCAVEEIERNLNQQKRDMRRVCDELRIGTTDGSLPPIDLVVETVRDLRELRSTVRDSLRAAQIDLDTLNEENQGLRGELDILRNNPGGPGELMRLRGTIVEAAEILGIDPDDRNIEHELIRALERTKNKDGREGRYAQAILLTPAAFEQMLERVSYLEERVQELADPVT